ncbi:hypothetical protein NDU88_002482 [Pleurodeles waltl]|uniref:Uncharacterized protein n=1 Tax=Pleurodeles waltl TaxID=8319 RepID=A0AAV7UVS3_PLEWA|nr:hypothetical protein NDU88_002482 [Pleurodeles waltl]
MVKGLPGARGQREHHGQRETVGRRSGKRLGSGGRLEARRPFNNKENKGTLNLTVLIIFPPFCPQHRGDEMVRSSGMKSPRPCII